MIFNSFLFLWSFPIIFICYYLLCYHWNGHSSRIGNYFLLVVSYGLYVMWNPIWALILLYITAVTYLSAFLIEKKHAYNELCLFLWFGLTMAVFPLLVFKYYNFFSEQLTILLSYVGVATGIPGLNWAMPLGISFYTLVAIGYLIDVYLQRIRAEYNWWDYMLFVSFFPQIASGPISKAADLLPQIKAKRSFNYNQAVQGLKWLLWGMFMKVVVADSLGMRVDLVYNAIDSNSGANLFLTSILYSFQIYCDFAGYSFMALGVGELLGFELVNNFRRPYFSQSITEFWHRWHISLSTWLKDYIYIPLGGSRCSKTRNYWNIMVTFLVSGLWHGANWTFIVWGGLHGLFQVVEKLLGLNKRTSVGMIRLGRVLFTFLLANFAWIFFRLPTLSEACEVVRKIFMDYGVLTEMPIIGATLVFVVLAKDLFDEKNIKQFRFFYSSSVVVRWIFYVSITVTIAIMGVYGGQFIYSGF